MFEFLRRLLGFEVDGSSLSAKVPMSAERGGGVRLPVPLIRRRMLDLAGDCPRTTAFERLEFGLNAANGPRDLWHLRSELFALLSTSFGQTEAARRINTLLPLFEGWVPATQLIKIQ